MKNINNNKIFDETENIKSFSINNNDKTMSDYELNEISLENILLYRSLYIIKRKFEIYKNVINEIYNEYDVNIDKINNHPKINVEDFDKIAFKIFDKINCFIINNNNAKDIFFNNLIDNGNNKDKMKDIFSYIKNLLIEDDYKNLKKYNEIYYNKKIKPFEKKSIEYFDNKEEIKSLDEKYDKIPIKNSNDNKENIIENINNNEIENKNLVIKKDDEETPNNRIDNNNSKNFDENKNEQINNNKEKDNEIKNNEIKEEKNNINIENKEVNEKEEEKKNEIEQEQKDDKIIDNKEEEKKEEEKKEEEKKEEEKKDEEKKDEEKKEEEKKEEEKKDEEKKEDEKENEKKIDEEKKDEEKKEDKKEDDEKKEEKEEKKEEINKEENNKEENKIENEEEKKENTDKKEEDKLEENNKDKNDDNNKIIKDEKKENEIETKENIINNNNLNSFEKDINDSQKNTLTRNNISKIECQSNMKNSENTKSLQLENNTQNSNEKIFDKNDSINLNFKSEEFIFKSNNQIYIESLPLIIAEFLQNNKKFNMIEIGDDLSSELNVLFDKEILNKISIKDKIEKQKKLSNFVNSEKGKELFNYIEQRKKIKSNINLYEKLISEKRQRGEITLFLEDVLEKLIAKEILIEHKIKYLKENDVKNELIKFREDFSTKNKSIKEENYIEKELINESNFSNMKENINEYNYINNSITKHKNEESIFLTGKTKKTRTEKRKEALKEIFNFYSNQHVFIGLTPTFSEIEKKKNYIDLSEYVKFCNDFEIGIIHQKINEIFKKNSLNYTKMFFDQFIKSLENLSTTSIDSKKNFIEKEIKETQEKLNLLEFKENQRIEAEKLHNLFVEKNTGGKKCGGSLEKKQFYYLSKHRKIEQEIYGLKYKLKEIENKSFSENLENFYNFLGLDDIKIYRKKMKGFFNYPFKTKDLKFRINKQTISHKLSENKSMQDILENQTKEKKLLELSKNLLSKDLLYQKKKELFRINNKKLQLHNEKRLKERKYIDLISSSTKKMLINKKKLENEKKNKFNWDKLNNINLKDLNLNEKDKEIFMDNSYNSDDDDLILNNAKLNNNNRDNQNIIKNNSALNIYSKQNNFNDNNTINIKEISNYNNNNNNNILPPIKYKKIKYIKNLNDQENNRNGLIRTEQILNENNQNYIKYKRYYS